MGGRTARANSARVIASMRSVLAVWPLARATSRVCRRLTIATGKPASARASAHALVAAGGFEHDAVEIVERLESFDQFGVTRSVVGDSVGLAAGEGGDVEVVLADVDADGAGVLTHARSSGRRLGVSAGSRSYLWIRGTPRVLSQLFEFCPEDPRATTPAQKRCRAPRRRRSTARVRTRSYGADRAEAVAVDADGNRYVAGTTGGSLEGALGGTGDAFLMSYTLNGDLHWTRQFGTEAYDTAVAVAVDGHGRVYVAGSTNGSLHGASAGTSDAFERAFAADGTLLLTRQFGTTGYDTASGVAVDQLGRVFVVGATGGDLIGANTGYSDVFERSSDLDGEDGRSRQFGSGEPDYGYGVSVGGDEQVVVAGYRFGGSLDGPPGGLTHAIIRAYSLDGAVLWTRQFGSTGYTESSAIAADDRGHVFLTGSVKANHDDALLVSYDANGGHRGSRSFGTESFDRGMAVATFTDRAAIAVGITGGVPEAPSAGGADVFARVDMP